MSNEQKEISTQREKKNAEKEIESAYEGERERGGEGGKWRKKGREKHTHGEEGEIEGKV